MDKITFYADVKPRLSVLQAVVELPKNSATYNVTADKIGVEVLSCFEISISFPSNSEDKERKCKFNLLGVNINPMTCHGLQLFNNTTLHLRFGLLESSEKNATRFEVPDRVLQNVDSERILEIFSGGKFVCRCSRCLAVILESTQFGKILHSPTDSCLESSESWWCHRHGHGDEDADGGVCKSSSHNDDHRSISPADTCLFNETNIIFIKKHLDSDKHSVVGEKCVVCSRCRNRIGYIADKAQTPFISNDDGDRNVSFSQECVRLMTHSLSISTGSCTGVLTWPQSRDELELKLSSVLLLERNRSNSFRFVIETRNEKDVLIPMILVWIMDVDTRLYIADSVASESALETVVSPISIVKLLYLDCVREENKSLGQEWYRDFAVQSVEMPESVCLFMLQMLVNSTWKLPRSFQRQNNFYVGYLRKESNKLPEK